MAKKTFFDILVGKRSKAYNAAKYTVEEAIEDYEREFGVHPEEDYIFYTYYRYITKEEIIASGDYEEINGYEDGSMTLFEECFETDKGAFKCLVIEGE